jgi:hypothetical protein
MPAQTKRADDYQTLVVGGAYLVKGLLHRLAACRRDNTLQRKAPLKLVLGVNMQGRAPLIGEKWP